VMHRSPGASSSLLRCPRPTARRRLVAPVPNPTPFTSPAEHPTRPKYHEGMSNRAEGEERTSPAPGSAREKRMSSSFKRAAVAVVDVLRRRQAWTARPRDGPTVSWIPIHPASSPGPQHGFRHGFRSVSQRVVLFGGYDGSRYLDETWTFDGAAGAGRDLSRRRRVQAWRWPTTAPHTAHHVRGLRRHVPQRHLGVGRRHQRVDADGARAHTASVTGPIMFTDPAIGRALWSTAATTATFISSRPGAGTARTG
jgi:hypothetical protein